MFIIFTLLEIGTMILSCRVIFFLSRSPMHPKSTIYNQCLEGDYPFIRSIVFVSWSILLTTSTTAAPASGRCFRKSTVACGSRRSIVSARTRCWRSLCSRRWCALSPSSPSRCTRRGRGTRCGSRVWCRCGGIERSRSRCSSRGSRSWSIVVAWHVA
jgi:hypothetical protein